MRARRKSWMQSELSLNEHLVDNPQDRKGQWADVFGNSSIIYAELGCGKGSFLVENARRYPEINFIGIEKEPIVVACAVRLARESGEFKNLKFIVANADSLLYCFDNAELSRLYLNFSDPWANRKKWAKRRLTHRNFLDIYEQILKPAELHFKTDDRQLFDFSVQEFIDSGYKLRELTNDLHNSEYVINNIQTEYERRFSEKGKPINRVVAVKG